MAQKSELEKWSEIPDLITGKTKLVCLILTPDDEHYITEHTIRLQTDTYIFVNSSVTGMEFDMFRDSFNPTPEYLLKSFGSYKDIVQRTIPVDRDRIGDRPFFFSDIIKAQEASVLLYEQICKEKERVANNFHKLFFEAAEELNTMDGLLVLAKARLEKLQNSVTQE